MGKKTGNTPDGRRAGVNHLHQVLTLCHGRDTHGALLHYHQLLKVPYKYALDGISNTFSIIPKALGRELDVQEENLVSMLDGYASKVVTT